MTTTLTNDQITAGAAVLCPYCGKADGMHDHAYPHPCSAPSPQIAEKVELRERLCDALIKGGHMIEQDAVTLYRSSVAEGNAFSQVLDRLVLAAQPAEVSAGQAGQVAKPEPTTIVQDVAALFRACGFDVREEPSALDPKGEFAIAGSLDAGGLLVESVIEHCENLRLAGAARQGGATQPSTAPTERAAAPADQPSAQVKP
ncbi:MAG TPA: hypothetical protein DDZ22_17225 [Massilia sp.]|nr:hypothetical protein [Massilia sp.]